jgi:GMP synthase (glutamine-hydrolysing)
MKTSRLIIIKAGTTFPNTARKFGDFENWTRHGLGLAVDQVHIIDAVTAVELPSPTTCTGVVVTGSHAMVSDAEPWSERLVTWIAQLIELRVPYLGICYGHQLLAKAAGGRVGYHPKGQEIGSVEVRLFAEHAQDALFSGLPDQFPVHVTHAQSVLSLPNHVVRLAANDFEHNHGIRVGDCAWGVQFHPEYNSDIMKSYIEEQSEALRTAGRNDADIMQTVKDTPEAASILRRFAAICSGWHPSSLSSQEMVKSK